MNPKKEDILAHERLLERIRQQAHKAPQTVAGWGMVVDPDGDCRINEEKGFVTITVPGSHHNLWPGDALNAPRVLTEVEGDFSVKVKVSGDFDPGNRPAWGYGSSANNGAGLLVWQDELNYIRFERHERRSGGRHRFFSPLLEHRLRGRFLIGLGPPPSESAVFKENGTFLRLDRRDDLVTAFWSSDGTNWKYVNQFRSFDRKKVFVGVSAQNATRKEFKASFEQFRVTPLIESSAPRGAASRERTSGARRPASAQAPHS
jgi:regulation of enolase protein 1 (concanavalin A-like superfamily)